MAPINAIFQPVLGLHRGRDGDFDKGRKRGWTEAAEAFCKVARDRGGSFTKLLAEFEISSGSSS